MKKLLLIAIVFLFVFSTCKKEKDYEEPNINYGSLFYEGHTYKTVIIGEQEWMAENLAFLPAVFPASDTSYTKPRYDVFGYDGTDVTAAKKKANYSTYGVLYNWPAAKAACPPGWHLPSDKEWQELEMALGMTQTQADYNSAYVHFDRGTDQGTQMKATHGWNIKREGTNTSGFSALPGGGSSIFGYQDYALGQAGSWWSSTSSSTVGAYSRQLHSGIPWVNRFTSFKSYGLSVRCVKD